jgi:hypothetical protein
MTRYEWDDNDDDEQMQVNTTALRRTCRFIRHDTTKTFYSASTIKLWEINQNALHAEHLELPIVQHVTMFWFKIPVGDVERIVRTPHLRDIITKKLPLLRRLQELERITVGFPKPSISSFATPGALGDGSRNRAALEMMRKAFDKGRVGKPVKIADAAQPLPERAFGAPQEGSDGSDEED